MVRIFGSTLLSKHGEVKTDEALEGKTAVAIYFGGHWCPPCGRFAPDLKRTYEVMKERGEPFEVIYSSCDENQAAFDNYYRNIQGDWLAVPFGGKSGPDGQACRPEPPAYPTPGVRPTSVRPTSVRPTSVQPSARGSARC